MIIMKKLSLFFILSLLLVTVGAGAQKKYSVYAVGFYNQENLFDTCHDAGKNDSEFLPNGSYRWNGLKYSHKLRNMARALADMGTDVLPGVGCAVIGVSEVENAKVLEIIGEVDDLSIEDFLDSLTPEQQRKATIHLNLLWAQREGAKINGNT